MDLKKCLLFSLLIIGYFQTSFGQGGTIEKISLAPEADENIENVNFYVEKVIDNRFSKTYLGIVQIGIYNARLPVAFEDDFSTELQQYLDVVFPKKAELIPITIRINDLIISEDTQLLKEQGIAKVQLDVLKPIAENSYELLGRYEAISKKNTLDATRSHPTRIKSALTECLLLFFKDNPGFVSQGVLNLNTFADNPPILVEPVEDGFFYSFFELQNNRPVLDNKIVVSKAGKRSKTEKLILEDENGNVPNYAAYYDGNNFYLNSNLYFNENYFVKTYQIDQFLLFNEMIFPGGGYVTDLNIANGRSGMPFLKERNCVLFDLTSGRFHVITKERMKTLLDEKYPDLYKLYKRYGKKDVKKVLEILTVLFEKEKPENLRATLTH